MMIVFFNASLSKAISSTSWSFNSSFWFNSKRYASNVLSFSSGQLNAGCNPKLNGITQVFRFSMRYTISNFLPSKVYVTSSRKWNGYCASVSSLSHSSITIWVSVCLIHLNSLFLAKPWFPVWYSLPWICRMPSQVLPTIGNKIGFLPAQ